MVDDKPGLVVGLAQGRGVRQWALHSFLAFDGASV